jgi:hypothetical protein
MNPVRDAMIQCVADSARRFPCTIATRQAVVDSAMFSTNGVHRRVIGVLLPGKV